ncbi:MAG: hypothetical protein E6Q71_07160 [Pseudomonas sp.]|nr:MAG: hypothetical protein E6Q71_07160 [Pseudomonas sp.]
MQAAEPMPIACTLSPAEMGPRLARIRQLTRDHLRSHRLDGVTIHLFYDPAASVELAEIVELELQCCAFLAFRLMAQDCQIRLEISAAADQATNARWLFSQFLPDEVDAPGPSAGCACCR